ncbi:poly-gamma-glutamate synthesis protein (capsule biosynthesis protein) [Peptostreptococcaceae bacterium pGA-8]|nr:poly-gamma-glutamate synthesis protein (capsule biosynthesis protein) [Peptostreptococcaceae bacterium pGA-8]
MSKKNKKFNLVIIIAVTALVIFAVSAGVKAVKNANTEENTGESNNSRGPAGEVTIMASGDMLYHDQIYWSGMKEDSYDFSNNYEKIKPLISSADLALGDFEGTIAPDLPLSGYPIFNAPKEVIPAIKAAGYDVIDLAHNHILDSYLTGALGTKKLFEDAGLDVIGVKTTADEKILVREVKGIKIAILGFAYGYNGLESNLTAEEYDAHLQDLNPEKVKATLAEAEKIADITVVMPQIGVEYSLAPTEEQVNLYHNMIDWGADIIFGGHPHVIEPTEIVNKDGNKKFIIYSMGNLLSNQRYETLENYWTERGVIMEVSIKKMSDKKGACRITGIKAHPTWVLREPNNKTHNGFPLYNYQTLLCEDYIEGGKHYGELSKENTERITKAYAEVMELLKLEKI